MLLQRLSCLATLFQVATSLAIRQTTDASSTGGGTWGVLANITSNGVNFPRQELSVVSVGTDVYALGGILPFDGTTYPTVSPSNGIKGCSNLADINEVPVFQKYSTTTNSWSNLPNMPVALNHANAAVVGTKIYVCGGMNTTATGGPLYWNVSTTCSYYDTTGNAWTVLPDVPLKLATGAAAVLVRNQTIYYAGGLKNTNLTDDEEGTVKTFASFNTQTLAWTQLPDMPAPRDHAGKGIIGDIIYVLGGRAFGHYNVVNTVFSYNITSKVWKTGLASMPTARGGVSSGTIGGNIYISGGEGDNSTTTGVFPQMQAYNAQNNVWTCLNDMTRPVHGTWSTVVNGKVIVVGGGAHIGGDPVAWTSSFTP